MMMIVLRLLSLLGLKSRGHRHFTPRPLNEVFFQGWVSADSWTLGPKPLCHRHPTGPQPSGLLWTPAKGDPTKSKFAPGVPRRWNAERNVGRSGPAAGMRQHVAGDEARAVGAQE